MLSAIKEVVSPEVIIECDTENKKLVIKEDGADSKVKKLHITHLPDDVFAFTLDHQPGGSDNRWFKQLSPYVNVGNDKGVNKGCDAIVLGQKGGKFFALVFDLKSDKPRPIETKRQLNNSEAFLKYLLAMVSLHYGVSTDEVEIKKAIVTTDKRGVRKSSTYKPNAKPTSVFDYHVESIQPKQYGIGYVPFEKLMRDK